MEREAALLSGLHSQEHGNISMHIAVTCQRMCRGATRAMSQSSKAQGNYRRDSDYLSTPPESSAKRLWSANSSPKAVKQLLTTDAR